MTEDNTKNTNPNDAEFDLGIDVKAFTPEERAMYDKINAQIRPAWLKKTSALADQRKAWEKEQADLKAQYGEAAQALQAWQQWYAAEGQFMTKAEQKHAMREEGLEEPNALMQELNALKNEFAKASAQFTQTLQQLSQRNQTLEDALGLSVQLSDLRFKHPDVDTQRVLTTAKERNIKDLDLAYKLAYDEELRSKAVEEQVKAREEEIRAKVDSERALVDAKPSTSRYAPPAEAKSYSEASNNLLSVVRKTGSVGPITD